jgi:hypothetical protein
LRCISYFKVNRHRGGCVRFHLNAALLETAKAGSVDLYRVNADRQKWEDKAAIGDGRRFAGKARTYVGDNYLCSDDSRAAGIGDCSGNRTCGVSSPQLNRKQEHGNNQSQAHTETTPCEQNLI